MIFLNSAGSAAALVFYLSGVCTHTDMERKLSPENILKTSKKTQFLMNTLYYVICAYLAYNFEFVEHKYLNSGKIIIIFLSYLGI